VTDIAAYSPLFGEGEYYLTTESLWLLTRAIFRFWGLAQTLIVVGVLDLGERMHWCGLIMIWLSLVGGRDLTNGNALIIWFTATILRRRPDGWSLKRCNCIASPRTMA